MKTLKLLFTYLCVVAPACSGITQSKSTSSNIDPNWPDCTGENCRILSATVETKSPCAKDMVHVKGKYCTSVKQTCATWLDKEGTEYARCQKYKPSECIGERLDKDFCIDQDEYTKPGETLPTVNISWYKATTACLDQGKRLCSGDEWTFACEGEEMYPYATGLERNSTDCNFDELHLGQVDHLIDHRKPSASLDKCVSPFGVRNMNGNVDEWVRRTNSQEDNGRGEFVRTQPNIHRSILKGGWWGPLRNRCRPATTAHGPEYSDSQVGFRCCSNVQ